MITKPASPFFSTKATPCDAPLGHDDKRSAATPDASFASWHNSRGDR